MKMENLVFPESELILNSDGSIYHLKLRPEHLANIVITVGDPDRVRRITNHFDSIEFKIQNREFVTHTGIFNNKRISVIATGIGTDNIDIVFNELDALANIDFKTRRQKETHTSLQFIRIGTSGCMREEFEVDSFLISEFGLGLDGLLNFYDLKNDEEETAILDSFTSNYDTQFLPYPYIARGNSRLIQKIGEDMHKGITVTCPGFYAPQGRRLMAKPKMKNYIENFQMFAYGRHLLTNFEMETAGIYGLSKVLGHEAISCNVLLANRARKTFSKNPQKAIDSLIENVLSKIA